MNGLASRIHCPTCGSEQLFTKTCCHCGSPHPSQVGSVDEKWLTDFIARSARAREKTRLRMQRSREQREQAAAAHAAKEGW